MLCVLTEDKLYIFICYTYEHTVTNIYIKAKLYNFFLQISGKLKVVIRIKKVYSKSIKKSFF